MKINMKITKSKITELMAGNTKLVSVVLGLGLSMAFVILAMVLIANTATAQVAPPPPFGCFSPEVTPNGCAGGNDYAGSAPFGPGGLGTHSHMPNLS